MRRVVLVGNVESGYVRAAALGVAEYANTQSNWELYITLGSETPTGDPWQPDGVLVHLASEYAESLAASGVPCVQMGSSKTVPGPRVCGDDIAIGRTAAGHLLERGLRNLTMYHCSLPGRELGFVQAVQSAGATYLKCPLAHLEHDIADWDGGVAELGTWLKAQPHPLGLFGIYDVAARFASRACLIAGLRIPEDVAIIGADDDELLCNFNLPPLSSVRQPTRLIGRTAAELLNSMMDGQPPPSVPIAFPPLGVAVRRSSDILAIDDPEVGQALRFMMDAGGRSLTVEDICHQIVIPRRTLERRFKVALGRTVLEELTRLKIEFACQRLSLDQTPIADIAIQCGFTSVRHFYKVFRQSTGQTPGDYRRMRHSVQPFQMA